MITSNWKASRARLWWLTSLAALLAMGTLIPTQAVRADVGPKPGMQFEFVREDGAPLGDLTILSGEMMECSNPDCSDGKPLERLGPQGFSCEEQKCSSLAYGYRDYHRLVLRFSDGVERSSNVFEKRYFAARYRVTVRSNDLVVNELTGMDYPSAFLPPPWNAIPLGAACLTGLTFAPALLLLGVVALRDGQGKSAFRDSRALYILIWVMAFIVLILGAWVSPSLPATMAVEGILALGYAVLRRRPKVSLVSVVLLVNMITQPALWLLVNLVLPVSPYLLLAGGEILIWLLEAGVLFVTQRRSLSLLESLGLSFALNAASFLVGLIWIG